MDILAMVIGILKSFGILILIILAILLLFILVILFSSIKFKVIAKFNDEINFFIKVTYIFGIVSYKFDSKDGPSILKIFGINFNSYKKFKIIKKKDFKNKKIEKIRIRSSNNRLHKESYNKNNFDEENLNDDYKENFQIEDFKQSVNDENLNESNDQDFNYKYYKKYKFKSIKEFLEKIKYFINYPHKKEIALLFYDLIKKIIRSINFKRVSLNIKYGLGDPFQTGCLCSIISNIILIISKKFIKDIKIVPDFENEIFLGNGEIIAKTNLIKILLPITIFITREPIKKIIFKKGE